MGTRGAEIAAEIREGIRLGYEIYIYDRFVEGEDQLGRVRQILIEPFSGSQPQMSKNPSPDVGTDSRAVAIVCTGAV